MVDPKCDPNRAGSDTQALVDYKDRAIESCAIELSLPGVSPDLKGAYQDCADALEQASCDDAIDVICAKTVDLKGTLAAGDACESNTQCSSGRCNLASRDDAGSTSSTPCGTCAKVGAAGDTCGDGTVQCGDGLYCNPELEEMKCVADNVAGDPCEFSCSGPEDLVCTDGVCKAPPTAGEACDYECAGSLRCIDHVCGAALAAGATCDPEADNCASGLGCDASTSKCAARKPPTQMIGQACDSSEKRCVEGYCGGMRYDSATGAVVDGTCRAYAKADASCDETAAASDYVICEPYLDCLEGTCRAPARRCTY